MKPKIKYQKDERWERATKLRCSYLRSEENPIGYRHGEPPSFWLVLDKDPCPTCDDLNCHNQGQKFDEPKRLIILTQKLGGSQ